MNLFTASKKKIKGDQAAILQDILSSNPALAINLLSQLKANGTVSNNFTVEDLAPILASHQANVSAEDTQEDEEEEVTQKVILGPEARLSECPLWQLQEDYFSSMGVSAWDGVVPCFVTSSAYIAEAYTEAIMAFLEDYYAHINPSEPIYIVEMATGVGRFSRMMLHELQEKLAFFSKFRDLKIRYVMTDFTESNVNHWKQHVTFQKYVECGMLDFAVFRPEDENTIQLAVSGEVISADTVKNPVIAIANYFFDSIRQDFFKVASKKLYEGLVTLEREASDPNAPVKFSEIEVQTRYNELLNDNYYDDPKFNAILNHYRHNIRSGAIIMPIGGLRVLRNLQTMSHNNLLLLSADKAYAELDHMLQYSQHSFAVHGSFSYMVNYDAIGQFFKNEGGHYFLTTNRTDTLKVVCCLQTSMEAPVERLNYFFKAKMNLASPVTSITELVLEAGAEETPREKIHRLLALLRISLSDPRIFCDVARQLTEVFPHMNAEHQHDLIELMQVAADKFYFFRGERNLPFWLAELYYRLGLQEQSLVCLEVAMECYTEFKAEYLLMMGRSYEQLNQWQKAVDAYESALELQPDYNEAVSALSRLRQLAGR